MAKTRTAQVSGRHFMGVADNVNLINLRVLDQDGAGQDSAVIAAIQAAISPEEQIQHSHHQPFAWPPGITKLYARPTLPGGRSGVESRHRGGGRGWQRRPQ